MHPVWGTLRESKGIQVEKRREVGRFGLLSMYRRAPKAEACFMHHSQIQFSRRFFIERCWNHGLSSSVLVTAGRDMTDGTLAAHP